MSVNRLFPGTENKPVVNAQQANSCTATQANKHTKKNEPCARQLGVIEWTLYCLYNLAIFIFNGRGIPLTSLMRLPLQSSGGDRWEVNTNLIAVEWREEEGHMLSVDGNVLCSLVLQLKINELSLARSTTATSLCVCLTVKPFGPCVLPLLKRWRHQSFS